MDDRLLWRLGVVYRSGLLLVMLISFGCLPYTDAADKVVVKKAKVELAVKEVLVYRSSLVKDLIRSGIYFYQVGEFTKLYVPVNILFKPFTAQWVRGDVDLVIEDIAALIGSYDVVELDVFSSVKGAKKRRYLNAIAKRQAQRVAKALVDHDVGVRIVTSRGARSLEKSAVKGLVRCLDHNQGGDNFGYIEILFRYNHRYFAS